MTRRTGSPAGALWWRVAAVALSIAGTLVAASPAMADERVEFYATVDRDRAAIDETVTLQVTLALSRRANPQDLELPQTPDFDVISQGSSEQSSFALGGGGPTFRRVRMWTLHLQPRREGKLSILPGSVTLDGKRYETGKLVVDVGPPTGARVQRPRQQQQPPQRSPGRGAAGSAQDSLGSILGGGPVASETDLFVRAVVDKTDAYIGEQITFSIYLLSRVDVSHVEGIKLPDLDGFWTESLETPRQISSSSQTIDGVPYRAYLIQRRALFPLRAGKLSIQPVELDVVSGRSVFGGGRKYNRKSPAAEIEIKPLPDGAPRGFSIGNVGKWEVKAEASPLEVSLGQPVTWKITATGAGNLRNLELPTPGDIEGFKVFEPTRTEKAEATGQSWGGSKTVEYVLVPEKPGTFELPSMEFSYFDPTSASWLKRSTQAATITVLQGQGQAHVAAIPQPPAEAGDTSGLRTGPVSAVVTPASVPIYEKPWFFAALALPLLTWIGSLVAPRLGKRRPKARKRTSNEATGLDTLKTLAARSDFTFYPLCEKYLLGAAAERMGREVAGMSRDELLRTLADGGVQDEPLAALKQVLEVCEMARWAPGTLPVDGAERILAAAIVAESGLRDGAEP